MARYRDITDGAEHITLVFDKGNNSEDNLGAVTDGPYHFIGSLVPTQHPELLQVPFRRFRSLDDDGLPGVSVYRTRQLVFGVERTVLRRQLHQHGIDRSIPDLLDQLDKIRQVGVVYPPSGKRRTPTLQMTLSQMSADQRALYDALDLGRYLSP